MFSWTFIFELDWIKESINSLNRLDSIQLVLRKGAYLRGDQVKFVL